MSNRFISRDRYRDALDKPLTLNRCVYGQNSSVNFIDHSGNIPIPIRVLALVWIGDATSGYATDPYYVEKVCQYIYRLETGTQARLAYKTDSDTKFGAKVTHVLPKEGLPDELRRRVYAPIRDSLLARHRVLWRQASATSWDYPNHIYMDDALIDVTK